MTSAATVAPTLGNQPIGNSNTNVEVAQSAAGYVPLVALGTIQSLVDPFLGGGEVIRLRVPAGTAAIPVGGAAVWTGAFQYTALPNTANLGQPVAFAVNAVPLNASFDQYAWFYVSGTFPAFSGASVAANAAIGITAAGQLGANSAGKQILGVKVQQAATGYSISKQCLLRAGATLMQAPNTDGWFVGMAVTGTGIPASTTITAIDASGTLVTMSAAATASGLTTVAGAYTAGAAFWNILSAQRPIAQGAIT